MMWSNHSAYTIAHEFVIQPRNIDKHGIYKQRSTLYIRNHKTTKFHTSLTFCTFTKMLHKIDNFKIMYCFEHSGLYKRERTISLIILKMKREILQILHLTSIKTAICNSYDNFVLYKTSENYTHTMMLNIFSLYVPRISLLFHACVSFRFILENWKQILFTYPN